MKYHKKRNDLKEAVARMDDLRNAETRRVNEQMQLRAEYNKQLGEAESKRIDAIRSVDVAAVAVASERATQQASVLASQVVASAETLRNLVSSTAATVAQQLAGISSQLSDRISSLEKSQYQDSGNKGGKKDIMGWIVGGVMVLIAIASFILPRLK